MISMTSTDRANLVSANPKSVLLNFDSASNLDNDDILMEQMSLSQSICDGQTLTLGTIFSSEFKVRIFNDDTTSRVGKWFTVTLSVDDTSTSVQLGRFKVVSETLTDDKLYKDIVAYDAMHDILQTNYADWHNSLSFPMTVKQYRDAFFSHVGITQVSVTLPNDSKSLEQTFVAESYSGADALKFIAEITGSFGIINNQGNFRWFAIKPTTYSSNIYTIEPDYIVQGNLKYEEFTTNPVACVHIRELEGDIGGSAGDITDGNTYYITGNLFASGQSTTNLVSMAQNILDNIEEISYTPVNVGCVGMPYLECGDVIKIETDRKTIISPIMSRTLTGISALRDNYASQGTEKFTQNVNAQSIVVSQLKRRSAVLTKTIEEVSNRMTEITTDLNENYYTKTQTQSYVGQTANNITASVNQQISDSQTSLKEYTNSQVSISADSIRTDVAYSINGTDQLSGVRDFTDWFKRSSTYVSVTRESDGYYNLSSSYTANQYIYGIHRFVDCTNKVGTHVFRCDVRGVTYFRVVATNTSAAEWVNSPGKYTRVGETKTYQKNVTTTSTNKYVHIYIGILSNLDCHIKNPRLIFGAGSSDLATALSSYVEQTASSISSKVSSNTYNSKMTQLDNAISQRVTSSKMNAEISTRVNKAIGTINLKVKNTNSGATASIVLKVGSKTELSTITLTGLVRFVDLSNKSKTTTIKGGNISSSSITLGGSGNGLGQLTIKHSDGSTVIGSLNNTGLMLKSTIGWFTQLDAYGNLLAGRYGNTYGRIDCSTGHRVNGVSGYYGMNLYSQIIRLNPSVGISVNGMLGKSGALKMVNGISQTNGGYSWHTSTLTIRGGIIIGCSNDRNYFTEGSIT